MSECGFVRGRRVARFTLERPVAQPKPGRVVRADHGVEVTNFRRLRVAQVRLDPDAGLVRVTGKNRAGKTSLLRAIQGVLGGAKAIEGNPIHDGENGAQARIVLSNGFAVERRFTSATPKGYLTVTSGDGGRYGQEKLNEWLGPHSFDPLAFMSLRPREKADLLLGLGKDPDLATKLEALDAERKRLYDERTPWITAKRAASRVPEPDYARPEPVDVSAEMERLAKLEAEQRERVAITADIQRVDEGIASVDEQIAELERKLEALRDRRARGEKLRAELVAKRDAIPDRTAAIEAVRAHIADAQAIDEQIRPWEEYDRAQERLQEARARERELTEAIQRVDEEKTRLLAEAAIPVTGLSFAEDGTPLLNGRPFEEASGAERIRLAVEVAMAANPKLRICLLDEANDLDLDSLAALDALAKEHGFQVWAVRIGLEGPGEIVVEDGEARTNGRARKAVPEQVG